MTDRPTKPSECSHRKEFRRKGKDIGTDHFVVFFSFESHVLWFFVADILWFESDGVALFQHGGASCRPTPTPDADEAHYEMIGTIKWDGCANLTVGECLSDEAQGFLHFCGRDDAHRITRMIDAIYDLAAEHIPHWDGERSTPPRSSPETSR